MNEDINIDEKHCDIVELFSINFILIELQLFILFSIELNSFFSLMLSIPEILYEMFGFEEIVKIFMNGLKVIEAIYFPDRNNLRNNAIKYGSVIVNANKVFNELVHLLRASRGVDTLLGAKGVLLSGNISSLMEL